MNEILAIVAAVCCIGSVHGYSRGAPTSQCVAMTPLSPHGVPQTAATSPYQITTNASAGYLPGETYSVTISKTSSSSTDFKGFLCQVRQVGQTAAFGTFAVRDASKAKTITCTSSGGAVTHMNKDTVSQQTFDWTAPSTPLGVGTQVQALCTVVQSQAVLWIQLKSLTFQELAIPTVAITTIANATVANTTIANETIASATIANATASPSRPSTMAPTTTPLPTVPDIPLDFSGCGTTTLCYRDPTNCNGAGDCKFALIGEYDANTTRMMFHLMSNSGGFAAVGFSRDINMGEDDVIACQRDTNTDRVYAKDGWNPDGRNPTEYDTDQTSFTSKEGAYVDGSVMCRIERVLTPSDTAQDYDLSQLYRLQFATGSSRGGQMESLAKHNAVPIVSDRAVNVTIPQIIGVEGKPLIKAHGIIMVFTWIGLVNIGILLAVHFKVVWPTGEWFQGHRAIMLLVWGLTVIGVIIIFVHAKEWVYDKSNHAVHNAHPIVGFITVLSAFAQPIMAAMRPHPGTPKRSIFNWVHRMVGFSAYVCGIVSVFFGLAFARDQHLTGLSDNATYVLHAWNGLQGCMWLVMGCIDYNHKKKTGCTPATNIEMKPPIKSDDPDSKDTKEPSEDANIRKAVLIGWVVISFGLSLVVAIYIGIAEL